MEDETKIFNVSKVSMYTNTDLIGHQLHCQEDLDLAHPKAEAAFVALSDQTIGSDQGEEGLSPWEIICNTWRILWQTVRNCHSVLGIY